MTRDWSRPLTPAEVATARARRAAEPVLTPWQRLLAVTRRPA